MVGIRKGKGFSKMHIVFVAGVLMLLMGFLLPLFVWASVAIKVWEAKRNLAAICRAQEAYQAKHGTYHLCKESPANGGTDSIPDPWVDEGTPGKDAFADIGFEPKGLVRYRYAVTMATERRFIATATGDLDGNGKAAVFIVSRASREYPKARRSSDRW